jgi:hypothetical protein
MRTADADGGGGMDDPVTIGDQRADERRVLDPAVDEDGLACRDMALDIGRQLRRGAVHLRIEAIEDDDAMAALDEQIDGVRSDEAGAAGDKYFHAISCLLRPLH